MANPFSKKLQSFDVTIGAAFAEISAPLLDLPRGSLVRRVFLNPSQHFSIAFPGGEFTFQRLRRYPGEAKPVVISWIVVFVFPGNTCDFGATFVENTGQNYVTANPHSWAARGTLGQIRCMTQSCVHLERLSAKESATK